MSLRTLSWDEVESIGQRDSWQVSFNRKLSAFLAQHEPANTKWMTSRKRGRKRLSEKQRLDACR